MKAAELGAPEESEAALARGEEEQQEWGRLRRHRRSVSNLGWCDVGDVARRRAVAEPGVDTRSGWWERNAEIPIISAME